MKTMACITLLFAALFVIFLVLGLTTYWHNVQAVQYLVLADDASTPAKKAEFLGKFIDKLDGLNLPEHAAFVYKHERNRVANQLEVLLSLKQRCDDLAKVNPSELGYAQGMTQVNGDEFKHALGDVRGIISDALWVKAGWMMAYGWLIFLTLVIVGFGGMMALSED